MADEDEIDAGLPAVTPGGAGTAVDIPMGGAALLDGYFNLSVLKQVGLMIALAASVAVGFWGGVTMLGGNYQPLYSSLQHIDANKVVEVLNSNNIQYKIDTSGALLVDEDDLFNARLKLADAGMQGDKAVGFELLDKEQPLGTSQFMESTMYRRSLEGELVRTIRSISKVRNARVHLAVPRASVFVRDQRKPTASVFLELYPGGAISLDQVRAIANLVASSIPQLKTNDVTVVDQKGNLLSRFEESQELAAANKELQYVRKVERDLVDRIENILRPVVGQGRFRAEVAVDVDFTMVEQTNEMFNPDLPAVRSEQTMEETKPAGQGVAGVPGALSNQPPGDGVALEDAGGGQEAQAAAVSEPGRRRQSTRNFELDRTISYTRHQVGRVRNLSVAVAVDDVSSVDAETGETSYKPWGDRELEGLAILIKDAVGFNAARGDSVNIVNARFQGLGSEDDFEMPEPNWWEAPFVMQVLKGAAIFFGFVLIMLILVRPVMKNLSSAGQSIRELEAQHAIAAAEAGLGESVSLTAGDSLLLPSPGESYEQQVNAVRGLVAEDPGRVAQVVKRWVASGD